ncbi:hypothetical protein J7I93_09155 [Bacillus sp. ISL-47]|uniref:helix-turn-helix domain-containing protein n=1 Tax=Bacillus sp. ISL-47 TaxID=2819130 RepID=UPI001BE60DF9|nr:helix-turn-helix domain-containing protein [Bacillus sp. ISL-47]MBT2688348.1 hypothetical protein [Bacillus sp. ISL-47]MBT2710541.1 hypothetical protein [Pseudomonas sp. ISL-84]
MKYNDLPDHLILNYEFLKISIFEEVKSLFQDRSYILDEWEKIAYVLTEEELKRQAPDESMKPSFRALFFLFTQTLYSEKQITKHMIRDAVNRYKDTIKILLAGHLLNEFPHYEIKRSINEEKIDEALERDYIYGSMDIDYHLMRDIVTKKKDFKEVEPGYLASEIIDNRGKVRGLAELRPYESQLTELASDQQAMWLELIESTLNSLDEMTADLFDLITYLWMVTPKSSDGFIEFHSNDALRLRNLKKRSANGRELDFREEDRFNIMKRVAALSSIWISLGEHKVKVINTQEMHDNELYKFKDFQKMFEIGKVRVAYDKKTGEAKGIYAVQVKPTNILTPYLVGPNRSIGMLDLKVFQYSHYTQREQKRLTRYLNLQWKIRTIKRTLQQPFKVSTLLKVIDISARYNGVQVRDKFENILDELQKDDVIRSWAYTEEINEDKVGKKGWFKDYWSKLSVIILPTEMVVEENKKNFLIQTNHQIDKRIIDQMNQITQENASAGFEQSLLPRTFEPSQKEVAASMEAANTMKDTNIKANFEQQSFHYEEEQKVTLSPEAMKEMIDSLNMSIRQAAAEIGIAHTTLSRYIRKENKRQNKNNDEKMLNWLKESKKVL